jgi:hypothetical protein
MPKPDCRDLGSLLMDDTKRAIAYFKQTPGSHAAKK